MDKLHGIYDALAYLNTNGKVGETYVSLEKKFKIIPNKEAGNRLKKLHRRFLDSNLSLDAYYANFVKRYELANTLPLPQTTEHVESAEQREWEFSGQSAYFKGVTEKVITSLDEALKFSNADLSLWEVERWKFNSWDTSMKIKVVKIVDGKEVVFQEPIKRTNYSVQVWFKPKNTSAEDLAIVMTDILKDIGKISITKLDREGSIGVVNIADIHMGADVSNLVKTPDFNLDVVREHFKTIAAYVNSFKYKEVYINLLGDYFESISGLNHLNTFKSLGKGQYGANIIKLGVGIISEFFSSLENLKQVNLISGNHDRITPKADVDNEGAAADMLAYCLQLVFPDLKINFHPYLISDEIDGICYILTHGQFALDKKDAAKIVKEYGSHDKYTLWLSGHIHSRKTTKVLRTRHMAFDQFDAVSMDEASYRKIVLPPVFTGNYYSETLGYTSSGGFVISENNGRGKPIVIDIPL